MQLIDYKLVKHANEVSINFWRKWCKVVSGWRVCKDTVSHSWKN